MTRPLIIAHRGSSIDEPENTIRAFKKAISIGADIIEFDVRKTLDGKIVVIHDPLVDRTTNGTGFVHEMTLKELKKLDAGKGEKIPELYEVLELFENNSVELVIEIKIPNVVEEVIKQVKSYDLEDRTTIDSFIYSEIYKVKEINDRIKTSMDIECVPLGTDIVSMAQKLKADVIQYYYHSLLFVPNLTEMLQKAGLKVWAWTVNDERIALKLAEQGVDGILTDNPEAMLKILSKKR